MSDKQEFTLEEILEEQRMQREEEARRQRALAPEYVEVDPETGTELERLEQDFDSSSLGEPEFVPPEQPARPEEREASFPEPQGGGHQEEFSQEEHLQEEYLQEEHNTHE